MHHAHVSSGSRAEKRHRRLQRLRIAAAVALVEGVAVGFLGGAFALARRRPGRRLGRPLRDARKEDARTTRDVLWIAAFSQTLAVVIAVLAFFVSSIACALAAVLAAVIIVLLLVDH